MQYRCLGDLRLSLKQGVNQTDSRESIQNENVHYIYHTNGMVRYLEEATGVSKDGLNQGDAWEKVTDLQLFEWCLPLLWKLYWKRLGTPGFLGSLVILTEVIFCSGLCTALAKDGKQTDSLHNILFFPHTFPLLALPLPQLRCIPILLPSRGKKWTYTYSLFCSSTFSGIYYDYRTLFLKSLIVFLFRSVFCRKCFMDALVFGSTTALKALVIIALSVGFMYGRLLCWNPQKSLHLLIYCFVTGLLNISTWHPPTEMPFVSFPSKAFTILKF